MHDTDLIQLYWDRDESAIRETEKIYGTYCFSIADHILHNQQDAEECVSDTWLRTWQTIPPGRPTRFRLFLARITRNLAFDMYRKHHSEKRGNGEFDAVLDELAECVAGSEDVEKAFDARQFRQGMNAFLKQLPQRERILFIRRYFYADPVKEIAEEYHMNANHVSVILQRVRKKLKIYLEQEDLL